MVVRRFFDVRCCMCDAFIRLDSCLSGFCRVGTSILGFEESTKRLVTAYDLARQENGDLLGTISELVSGTETLRAYQAHAPMVMKSKRAVRRRADAQIKAGVIGAFLFPSGEVFAVFTIVAIIAVGVFRGVDSGLTAGSMVGFVFLTYRFLEPIAEFTEVVDQTQTAVAGLRRVLSVLDTPVGPPAPNNPIALPEPKH